MAAIAQRAGPHRKRRIYTDVTVGAAERTRAMAIQGEKALGKAIGAAIAARRRLDRAVR